MGRRAGGRRLSPGQGRSRRNHRHRERHRRDQSNHHRDRRLAIVGPGGRDSRRLQFASASRPGCRAAQFRPDPRQARCRARRSRTDAREQARAGRHDREGQGRYRQGARGAGRRRSAGRAQRGAARRFRKEFPSPERIARARLLRRTDLRHRAHDARRAAGRAQFGARAGQFRQGCDPWPRRRSAGGKANLDSGDRADRAARSSGAPDRGRPPQHRNQVAGQRRRGPAQCRARRRRSRPPCRRRRCS